MLLRKHFAKYYLKYGLILLLGIAVLISIDYLQLQLPKIFGEIITWTGKLTPDPSTKISLTVEEILIKVNPLFMRAIIIVLIVGLGRFLWRYALFGTARLIEYEIRTQMFDHATKLGQDFYSTEKVGGLMTYFINDLNSVREVYGAGLLTLTDALFMGGFGIYEMIKISFEMTLFAAIPLILIGLMLFLTGFIIRYRFKLRQESFEAMSDFTQESFSGLAVVKAFVKEWKESLIFSSKSANYKIKSLSHIRITMIIQAVLNGLLTMILMTLIGFGSYAIINGDMDQGTLVAFFGMFFSLMWPMRAVSRFMYINSQGQASATRIAKFLDSEIEVVDNEIAQNFPKETFIKGNIEFRNLTYVYPETEKPALNDVSFIIKQGQMVGIVGRTGSGKTTLVDTILRVHNVPKETVFIDGYDLMNLPFSRVRNLVGYVPQDNFLFSDSIKNNISFADHNMGDEEIVEASKLSDVYGNIIEFKDGFETKLAERGSTVSGGQKQRIAIARAIAKKPEILILDDSVSAVDTKTEETIISNLIKSRSNQTTILIAHRISTVKRMDTIILLEEGKVIAQGSHANLLKTSSVYQEMVKRQELEIQLNEGSDYDV